MTQAQIANVKFWIEEMKSGRYVDGNLVYGKEQTQGLSQSILGFTPQGVAARIACKQLGLPIRIKYHSPYPLLFDGSEYHCSIKIMAFYGLKCTYINTSILNNFDLINFYNFECAINFLEKQSQDYSTSHVFL